MHLIGSYSPRFSLGSPSFTNWATRCRVRFKAFATRSTSTIAIDHDQASCFAHSILLESMKVKSNPLQNVQSLDISRPCRHPRLGGARPQYLVSNTQTDKNSRKSAWEVHQG